MVPGAGMDKDFVPFETVEKDGFTSLDCVKDYMYSFGDKFGDNKHDYKLEDSANVSIVLYDAFVPKDKKQSMTPSVCFEFCRTVPDMLFFGLTNGRECYCAPYYKPMESDSSSCDLPCVGDPTSVCGSKIKSSVFEMHFCDTTKGDLTTATEKTSAVAGDLEKAVDKATGLSKDMNAVGEELQKVFGKAGDLPAGDLMQEAKMFAGVLEHTAEDSGKVASKLKDLVKESEGLSDFSKPDTVTKAEHLLEDMTKALAEGKESAAGLESMTNKASPLAASKGAAAQYYPIMYFVDKDYEDMPSTCSGEPVGKPIVGKSMDDCAAACDADVHSCAGFSYFGNGKEPLCFLFSNFKSAVYYKGCDKSAMLLQDKKSKQTPSVTCVAKLSDFDGTTLKPDKSGKCKQCLKTLVEADRCY